MSDRPFRAGQHETRAAQQQAAGTRCRICQARPVVKDGRVSIPHLATCPRYQRPRVNAA